MYAVLINPSHISVDEVIGFDSQDLAEQYLKDNGWEQYWQPERKDEWTKEDADEGCTLWALVAPITSPSHIVVAS